MRNRILQAFVVLAFMASLLSGATFYAKKDVQYTTDAKMEELHVKAGENSSETLQNYLDVLPSEVTQLLMVHQWGYIVDSEDEMAYLAMRYGYDEKIIGLTVYDNHIIYLPEDRIDSLVHETWHAVDYIQGFPSKEADSIEIYNAERELFQEAFPECAEANVSSPAEFFAESFQKYVLNNEALKVSCPKTYDYIKNHISMCKRDIEKTRIK